VNLEALVPLPSGLPSGRRRKVRLICGAVSSVLVVTVWPLLATVFVCHLLETPAIFA
jgi:hypothetical protein